MSDPNYFTPNRPKEKPLVLPRPSGLFGKRGFSEKSKEVYSWKIHLAAHHLKNEDDNKLSKDNVVKTYEIGFYFGFF